MSGVERGEVPGFEKQVGKGIGSTTRWQRLTNSRAVCDVPRMRLVKKGPRLCVIGNAPFVACRLGGSIAIESTRHRRSGRHGSDRTGLRSGRMRDVCTTFVRDTRPAAANPGMDDTSPYLPDFDAPMWPAQPPQPQGGQDLHGGRVIGGVVVEAPVALVCLGQLVGGRPRTGCVPAWAPRLRPDHLPAHHEVGFRRRCRRRGVLLLGDRGAAAPASSSAIPTRSGARCPHTRSRSSARRLSSSSRTTASADPTPIDSR